MESLSYYTFIECNNNESEKWYFLVPMTKNHRDQIAELIQSTDEFDSPYHISDIQLTEQEAKKFVKSDHYMGGYMNTFNLCDELLEDFIKWLPTMNLEEDDPFYKGSCWKIIRDFEIE